MVGHIHKLGEAAHNSLPSELVENNNTVGAEVDNMHIVAVEVMVVEGWLVAVHREMAPDTSLESFDEAPEQ